MSLIQNINNAFDKGKQVLLVIDKANYDNIKAQLELLKYKCFDQPFLDHFATRRPPNSKDYPLAQWRKDWQDFKDYIIQSVTEEDKVFFSCFENRAKIATKNISCPDHLLDSIAYRLENQSTKIIVVIDYVTKKSLTDNDRLERHEFSYNWKIIYAAR